MKKRLTVIPCAVALMLAACVAAAGVGRMEYVAADLAKRTATVAWTWTDLADNAVRLSLTRNGEDFPTAGWGGTLFMGDGALGCAVAGTPSGYNDLLFDVGRDNVPTNGKYVVQIIATNTAGRVEEWARGTLTVRANPAAEGMPTNWSAYAELAAKVAPYIDATGILSDPANAAALWSAVSNRTDALIQAVAPAGQPPANYAAVSNAAMHAVTRDEYGMVTVDNMQVRALAVNGASGWPEYRILFGPNDLDGTYLYWNADNGRFATWRTAYGGDLLATESDLATVAAAATNYTDGAISTNNPAFVAAVVATPTGAPAGDVAEIAEYGSYGTVGAAILALIAGLAALKRGKFDTAGDARTATAEDATGTESYAFVGSGEVGNADAVARIKNLPYENMGEAEEMLVGVYALSSRGVQRHTATSGETSATFGFADTPGTGKIADAILDIDNSGNTSALGMEFYGLGTTFVLAPTDGEDLAEMTSVDGGKQARFYFTETALVSNNLPVISIQRITLGAVATAIARGS